MCFMNQYDLKKSWQWKRNGNNNIEKELKKKKDYLNDAVVHLNIWIGLYAKILN